MPREAVVALLASLLGSLANAQKPEQAGGTAPRRRLSIALEVGQTVGGPGSGLAAQLRRAGFDDTSVCSFLCSGTIAHPTQEGAGPSSGLTVRLAIGSKVAVGAGFGNASLGGSIGYREDGLAGLGDYILSDWEVSPRWATAFWIPHRAVRLGAGPGWYRLENVPRATTVSRIGMMLEAGAELPADRRLFLNLAVRAHVIPSKDVEHDGTARLTLRPKWTHVALLVGLGIHL